MNRIEEITKLLVASDIFIRSRITKVVGERYYGKLAFNDNWWFDMESFVWKYDNY
jgi:hypothetical protein